MKIYICIYIYFVEEKFLYRMEPQRFIWMPFVLIQSTIVLTKKERKINVFCNNNSEDKEDNKLTKIL